MPTYPLDMPTTGMQMTDFQLVWPSTTNTLRSGAEVGRLIAPAYWTASLETTPLTVIEHGQWDGFFDALHGDTELCLLFDTARAYPKSYSSFSGMVKAGTGTAFIGTAVVTAITTPTQVGLSGLPANFVLLRGDYIGFVQSSRYSLHRIVDDVTANSSGVISTLNFEPDLPDSFTTSAVANVYQAKGEFVVSDTPDRARRDTYGTVSFKAKGRAV